MEGRSDQRRNELMVDAPYRLDEPAARQIGETVAGFDRDVAPDPIDEILLKAPLAVGFGKLRAGPLIMDGVNLVCPKDVITVGGDDFDAIGWPRRRPKQTAPAARGSRMHKE